MHKNLDLSLLRAQLQCLKAQYATLMQRRDNGEYSNMHPQDQMHFLKRMRKLPKDISRIRQTILGLR